jgi:hypothetical protein
MRQAYTVTLRRITVLRLFSRKKVHHAQGHPGLDSNQRLGGQWAIAGPRRWRRGGRGVVEEATI